MLQFTPIKTLAVDRALLKKPKDFEELIALLVDAGFEFKDGKQPSLRGKNGDRFIRFRSLGEGYTVEDLKAALSGEKRHSSQSRKTQTNRRSLNVPIDIQEKLAAGQGAGYERWANELDPLKILHTTLGHTKNTQGEYLLIGGRVGHDRAIDRIGLVVLRQISTLAASETWPAWQKGSLLLSCLPGQ